MAADHQCLPVPTSFLEPGESCLQQNEALRAFLSSGKKTKTNKKQTNRKGELAEVQVLKNYRIKPFQMRKGTKWASSN